MKNYFAAVAAIIVITLCIAGPANAQEAAHVPKWVSDKGYWVVESQLASPDCCTVYFYNNERQLVYKESLKNTRLNINKRKVRMLLKKVLEQSVIAFRTQQQPQQDQQLLAVLGKKK